MLENRQSKWKELLYVYKGKTLPVLDHLGDTSSSSVSGRYYIFFLKKCNLFLKFGPVGSERSLHKLGSGLEVGKIVCERRGEAGSCAGKLPAAKSSLCSKARFSCLRGKSTRPQTPALGDRRRRDHFLLQVPLQTCSLGGTAACGCNLLEPFPLSRAGSRARGATGSEKKPETNAISRGSLLRPFWCSGEF